MCSPWAYPFAIKACVKVGTSDAERTLGLKFDFPGGEMHFDNSLVFIVAEERIEYSDRRSVHGPIGVDALPTKA